MNYKNAVVRILDANFNRAKEGLRVCEDIMRLGLNHKKLTVQLRAIRHTLSAIFTAASIKKLQLILQRDINTDCGKRFDIKSKKNSVAEIFYANAQRTKEALRVLEETSCLFDTKTAQELQRLRFRFYAIEKEAVKKMKP